MSKDVTLEYQSMIDTKLPGGTIPQDTLWVSPRIGDGYLSRSIELSNGLSVHLQEFRMHGTGNVMVGRGSFEQPEIFFYTCLSGVSGISESWPGSTHLSRLSGVELNEYPTSSMEVRCSQPIRTVTVGVDSNELSRISGLNRNDILEMLHRASAFLECKSTSTAPLSGLDLELRMVAGQALRGISTFPDDTLYIKAKALEILALHIRQLASFAKMHRAEKALPDGPDQVALACDILTEEMADPPGARELACRVGMNHNQLVAAFRERMNLTPFSYLRNIRLDRARNLLAKGRCNVTEAAYLVGYGSLSHFTKAFRDQFGINPKSWAKKEKSRDR